MSERPRIRATTVQLIVQNIGRFRSYAATLMRKVPAESRVEDADDVVQEAIEDYLRHQPASRSETHFLQLFRHIIKRAFTDKEKIRRAAKRGGGSHQRPLPETSQLPIRPNTGPLTALSRRERHEAIAAALARLSKEDQEVLKARNWEELPWKEVSARLNLPSEDAARMQYRRALDRLRSMIVGAGNIA